MSVYMLICQSDSLSVPLPTPLANVQTSVNGNLSPSMYNLDRDLSNHQNDLTYPPCLSSLNLPIDITPSQLDFISEQVGNSVSTQLDTMMKDLLTDLNASLWRTSS